MSRVVGRRVKALREARGWTKPELARRARVAYLTLWRIEASEQIPTLQTVRKLARALGVSVSRFLA
jgi:transcriptional regulator with XRE-family HTH domain